MDIFFPHYEKRKFGKEQLECKKWKIKTQRWWIFSKWWYVFAICRL